MSKFRVFQLKTCSLLSLEVVTLVYTEQVLTLGANYSIRMTKTFCLVNIL